MRHTLLLSLFVAAFVTVIPAQSQLGTGAISGTVQDATGAAVPDAQITITQSETGLVRTMKSSGAGQFLAPVLPTGAYRVRIAKAGFATQQQDGVVVNVGATASIATVLLVGDVAQTVTVNAASSIDAAETDVSSLVDRREISDLPINGRRYYDFALLTPGVARDGRFGLLSFRGTSGNFDNYMVEGNDDNQAYFAENRGRYRAPSTVSADAVQEFQVGQGAYLAEFGRASGGSVNMVLRSGGNTLHGDGFYYYRDQSFAARDPLAAIKPPERRQQLGGSLAGPIRSNRLFYFVNYDQQIRNFPLVIQDLTGALTSGKPTLPANATAAQQTQYNTDLAAFNAGVAFVLKQFPGGAPGNLQSRTMGNNIALGKIDYLVSNSTTLSTFFNYMRSHGDRAIQTPIVLGNVGRNGTDDVRIDSYNARLTTTLGPRRVNELRFQWSRDFEYEIGDAPPPETYANGSGNFSFGLATFLQRYALPDERRTQVVDNFSYTTGRHAFKFGGEANRVNDFINNPTQFGGTYTYASTLALGRDLVTPGARNYTSFVQDFGLAKYNYSTVDFALFVQDQWKPVSRVTINYGLRWDKETMPAPFAPNPAIAETQHFPTDWHSVGPRVGVGMGRVREGPHRGAGRLRHVLRAHSQRHHRLRAAEYGADGPFESAGGFDIAAYRCQRSGLPECFAVGAHEREPQHHGHAAGRQLQPAAGAGYYPRHPAAIAVGPGAERELRSHLWRPSGGGGGQQSAGAAVPAYVSTAGRYDVPGAVLGGHYQDGGRLYGERERRAARPHAGRHQHEHIAGQELVQRTAGGSAPAGCEGRAGERRVHVGESGEPGGQRQWRRVRGGDGVQRGHPGRPVQLRQEPGAESAGSTPARRGERCVGTNPPTGAARVSLQRDRNRRIGTSGGILYQHRVDSVPRAGRQYVQRIRRHPRPGHERGPQPAADHPAQQRRCAGELQAGPARGARHTADGAPGDGGTGGSVQRVQPFEL